MYKKLSVYFLVFQFALTLLAQLVYLYYTVETAEKSFAQQAQAFFDGEGEAPVFCKENHGFSTLHAVVVADGRETTVFGKSEVLAEWTAGILPLFFVWMLASLVLSLLLSGGVCASLRKPLCAIRQGMEEWNEKGEMPSIEIFGGDELGKTGRSVVDCVRKAEGERKASMRWMRHELLNPLAALQGAAESMWEETGSGLAHVLLRESARMEDLVRVGTGQREEKKRETVCDLYGLYTSALSLCCGMAKKEGRITVCVGRKLFSCGVGNAEAYLAALLNLQQNALRHSPSDSKTVFCTLQTRKSAYFLFYNRIEKSKGGDKSGLSSVLKICRENGGGLRAGRVKEGGYLAVLSIPVL